MKGRILQGIGSFYTVESEGQLYVCRARGRFRKQRISPMVGDEVLFAPPGPAEEEGFLEEILPRSSELLRPPVANVDLLFVTGSRPRPRSRTCCWPTACSCARARPGSRPRSSSTRPTLPWTPPATSPGSTAARAARCC